MSGHKAKQAKRSRSLKRAQSRAFGSPRWRKLRWDVAKRANYRCELGYEHFCEVYPGDDFQVDHKHPRYLHQSMDEFWVEENLQYVCRSCHAVKTRREYRFGKQGKDSAVVADLEKYETYLAGLLA